MKKILLALFAFTISIQLEAKDVKTAKAQEPFEGELVYSSFENYDKKTIKRSAGMAYNGVRKTNILVKGDKIHITDQSMHMHTILDPDQGVAYLYSDASKEGLKMDYTKWVDGYMSANDPDVMNRKNDNPNMVVVSTVKNTGNKVKYLDYTCDIYAGQKTMGTYSTLDYTLWTVENYNITRTIKYFLSGLKFNGLPAKYTWGGYMKIPLLGTMTSYVCSELKSVTPKTLNDSDFVPAEDIVLKETNSALKILSFYKSSAKYLKKNGMYPTDAEQESDATYKIEDEWDF